MQSDVEHAHVLMDLAEELPPEERAAVLRTVDWWQVLWKDAWGDDSLLRRYVNLDVSVPAHRGPPVSSYMDDADSNYAYLGDDHPYIQLRDFVKQGWSIVSVVRTSPSTIIIMARQPGGKNWGAFFWCTGKHDGAQIFNPFWFVHGWSSWAELAVASSQGPLPLR